MFALLLNLHIINICLILLKITLCTQGSTTLSLHTHIKFVMAFYRLNLSVLKMYSIMYSYFIYYYCCKQLNYFNNMAHEKINY